MAACAADISPVGSAGNDTFPAHELRLNPPLPARGYPLLPSTVSASLVVTHRQHPLQRQQYRLSVASGQQVRRTAPDTQTVHPAEYRCRPVHRVGGRPNR